jgi:hypothetical protein
VNHLRVMHLTKDVLAPPAKTHDRRLLHFVNSLG